MKTKKIKIKHEDDYKDLSDRLLRKRRPIRGELSASINELRKLADELEKDTPKAVKKGGKPRFGWSWKDQHWVVTIFNYGDWNDEWELKDHNRETRKWASVGKSEKERFKKWFDKTFPKMNKPNHFGYFYAWEYYRDEWKNRKEAKA